MRWRVAGEFGDGARHVRLIGKSGLGGDGGQRRRTGSDVPEGRVRLGFEPEALRRYAKGAAKAARQRVRRESVMRRPKLQRDDRIAPQIRRQQIRPIARLRERLKQ